MEINPHKLHKYIFWEDRTLILIFRFLNDQFSTCDRNEIQKIDFSGPIESKIEKLKKNWHFNNFPITIRAKIYKFELISRWKDFFTTSDLPRLAIAYPWRWLEIFLGSTDIVFNLAMVFADSKTCVLFLKEVSSNETTQLSY